jgi:hypothetical protein
MKSPCAVDLHNAVTVSQQRLGKRVGVTKTWNQNCFARESPISQNRLNVMKTERIRENLLNSCAQIYYPIGW